MWIHLNHKTLIRMKAKDKHKRITMSLGRITIQRERMFNKVTTPIIIRHTSSNNSSPYITILKIIVKMKTMKIQIPFILKMKMIMKSFLLRRIPNRISKMKANRRTFLSHPIIIWIKAAPIAIMISASNLPIQIIPMGIILVQVHKQNKELLKWKFLVILMETQPKYQRARNPQ